MKIRIISYITALVMLISVLLSAVSCDLSSFEQLLADPNEYITADTETNDKEDKTTKEDDETRKEKESDTEDEDRTTISDEKVTSNHPLDTNSPDMPYPEDTVFPSIDPVPDDNIHYDDREFFYITLKQSLHQYYVVTEENTFLTVANAADQRNRDIYNNYGIEIINKFVSSTTDLENLINESMMTGLDSVQAFISPIEHGIARYATIGYLADFNTLGIDLHTDHWNYELMENISINGQLLAGHGDMLPTDANILVVNRDIANEYMLEDLYELVYNGEWTLDKLYEISNIAYQDNSQYGISGSYSTMLSGFTVSSGISLVVKDYSSGQYDLITNGTELTRVFKKIKKVFMDSPAAINNDMTNQLVFMNGRSLFEMTTPYSFGKYLKCDFSIGVLPYPKAEVEQEDYKSFYRGGYICVLNPSDPDFVGVTLDLLNRNSTDIEESMWFRVLSSKDDMEMMRMIKRNLSNEFSYSVLTNELSSLTNIFSDAINQSGSIEKVYASQKNLWRSQILKYSF